MFDTEYKFEELPLIIGTVEHSLFDGVAALDQDEGETFIITAIELTGNTRGDYSDKRTTTIHPKHDDPFCVLLFNRLSEALYANKHVQETFAEELALSMWEAA